MAFLSWVVLLALCAYMFRATREMKFSILVLSTICFDSVWIPIIPFGSGKYLLTLSFLLSELPKIKQHIKEIKNSIVFKLLLIAFVALVVSIVTSPHYNHNIVNSIKLLIIDYVVKYLAIGYAIICMSNERGLRTLMNVAFVGLLILTFFGIINLMDGNSSLLNQLGTASGVDETMGESYAGSTRFRVQAMFKNPFDYGYICVTLMILHWIGYRKELMSKKRFLISACCCMFGVIFCECRTNVLCLFVAILSCVWLKRGTKRMIRPMLFAMIASILLYMSVSSVREKVNHTIVEAIEGSEGSSIEMRVLQYATTLYYIRGHELFGRGKGFFWIDLGFGEAMDGGGRDAEVDHDLWGLEGIVISLLLESGLVGLLAYIIVYFMIFRICFNYRQIDEELSIAAIAILTSYMAFANVSGELNSVYPTLLVVGAFISVMYHNQKNELKQEV